MRTVPSPMALMAIFGLGISALSAGEPTIAASTMADSLFAGSLTISVPSSANFGASSQGATLSRNLGTVTVSDSRPGPFGWTATVSATNFTTSGGTITKSNASYWSGPPTLTQGGGNRIPGQPTAANAQPLSGTLVAFSSTKVTGNTITSWAPTIVIHIPVTATFGTYTGTITHSVG